MLIDACIPMLCPIAVFSTLVETVFTCDNPAVFRPGGQSCFQDPIDRAWGRGILDLGLI